jgi:hypothetical protein
MFSAYLQTFVPDDEHFIEIEDTTGERCREADI